MAKCQPGGLVIAGGGSGSGKTAAAIGLIAALNAMGISVQPAKAGPDFLDAAWLAKASCRQCPNLDLWMAPEPARIMDIVRQFVASRDFLLVEGAMGIYDGVSGAEASTANLAGLLGLPVLLLLNCKGMGQTAAALASGVLDWHSRPRFCGIVCTHTGSKKHEQILKATLEPVCHKAGIPFLGCLPAKNAPAIPSRHLGLVQACEMDLNLKKAGEWFAENVNINQLLQNSVCVSIPVSGTCDNSHNLYCPAPVIGIARDKAFSFCYADLPGLLESLGASVVYFSPLKDKSPPKCDALYFPGGYPELYAGRLSANRSMLTALSELSHAGMPIYGECGGYMYLLQTLEDADGQNWPMAGLLPGKTKMGKRLAALGYRAAKARFLDGKLVYGHEFHYAMAEGESAPPLWEVMDADGNMLGKSGQSHGGTAGSWLHLYPQGSRDFWRKYVNLAKRWSKRHA